MTPIADGVRTDTTEVRFLGLRVPATMTALRLSTGAWLIHSPIALTPERQAAVGAPVSHLYSPNTYHHLRLGDWARAFPGARVHGPKGLVKKRPDLTIHALHGAPIDPDVVEVPIDGFALQEAVLFHRPSRTLVVADLLHNLARPDHGWTSIYTSVMGFNGRVAVSRMIWAAAFRDKPAARRSIARVLELPFDRIIVGHGAPVTERPKEALARVYGLTPAG